MKAVDLPRTLRTVAKNILNMSISRVGAFATPIAQRDEIQGIIRAMRPMKMSLMRFGGEKDGGYLVPDDFQGITACFSPGVNDVSEFERACAERGMVVFLADASVDGPADHHERFHFTKKYVGAVNDATFMTLDAWVNASAPGDSDLMLQIDIEGFEYETLFAASEALMRRFRIIVMELHDLDCLWSRPFCQVAGRALKKVLSTHQCIHLHPNNTAGITRIGGLEIPTVMEATFVRRDRVRSQEPATTFPHALDRECSLLMEPLPLPACWYRGV